LYAAYYGAGTIAGTTWVNYLSETHMKVSEVFLLNAGIVFIVGLMILFFLKKKPTP
jgi:sugar phosphate permease